MWKEVWCLFDSYGVVWGKKKSVKDIWQEIYIFYVTMCLRQKFIINKKTLDIKQRMNSCGLPFFTATIKIMGISYFFCRNVLEIYWLFHKCKTGYADSRYVPFCAIAFLTFSLSHCLSSASNETSIWSWNVAVQNLCEGQLLAADHYAPMENSIAPELYYVGGRKKGRKLETVTSRTKLDLGKNKFSSPLTRMSGWMFWMSAINT